MFNRLIRKPAPRPFTFRVSKGVNVITSFSVLSDSSCKFIFLSSTRKARSVQGFEIHVFDFPLKPKTQYGCGTGSNAYARASGRSLGEPPRQPPTG